MFVAWKNNVSEEDIRVAQELWDDISMDLAVLYMPERFSREAKLELLEKRGIEVEADISDEELDELLETVKSEYGLSLDINEHFGEKYIAYVFATGGPHYELRFYEGYTEFVYLDWAKGVAFDVSRYEVVKAIREELHELGLFEELLHGKVR